MGVVAGAEHQSAIGRVRVGQFHVVPVARAVVEIDHDDVFLERLRMGDDVARRIHRERVAVEDELIVAADLVDADDGAVVGLGLLLHELLAERILADGPGRGGHVEDEVELLLGHFGEGILGVLAGAAHLVGPDVLADGEGDLGAADLEGRGARGGLEIAGLVEDVVSGEQGLERDVGDLAAFEEGRRIIERLSFGGEVLFHEADQRGDVLDLGRQLAEGGDVLIDERGTVEEVARRVAREAQLGEDDERGAELLGAADVLQDLVDVALDIPDGGVDLCGGDFHRGSFPEPTGAAREYGSGRAPGLLLEFK